MLLPRAVLVLLVAALVAVACTGEEPTDFPPPPTTVAITTAPPPSDLSRVEIAGAPGRATVTSVQVRGGEAGIVGTVTGPGGPLPGATIRVERLVDDRIGVLDVQSYADGTFTIPFIPPPPPPPTLDPAAPPTPPTPPTQATTTAPIGPTGILGGRYRIRAWRPPDLALTAPVVLFLGGKEKRSLGLALSRYSGTGVTSDLAPDPPVVGEAANLVVLVTTRSVDGNGIVRSTGVPAVQVTLAVSGGWTASRSTMDTDSSGRALFQLSCDSPGQHQIRAVVNGTESFQVPAAACVTPPPSTTAPSSTDPGGTTPTTDRRGATTTTDEP